MSVLTPPSEAETLILRRILASDDGFVSGTTLADELGISRVAVWQHMEKLRAQGFTFEALRSRGYRLTARPRGLHRGLVEAHLGPQPRIDLVWREEIDSTNDEAARLLATGATAPLVVLALRQTRGRGRLGRAWHSTRPDNLYLSFAFRPSLAPDRMQTFTLWMGVNLCDLVEVFCRSLTASGAESGVRPGLKWPNDLLFNGRKAGGMLTEARVDADRIRDLVFGLGLNVNSQPRDWPADLASRAISIAEHLGRPLDLNRLTAALIGRVVLAYNQFVDGSYLQTFADLWNRYDALRGLEVTITEGARESTGLAFGIDDAGALLLRDPQGRTTRFRAGEATLRR